jgi:3-methyladenine DNA glycosylase AlkD
MGVPGPGTGRVDANLCARLSGTYTGAMTAAQVLAYMERNRNSANLAGMARVGIETAGSFGLTMPELRRLAKTIGTDHPLALALYQSGSHDCKLLSALIDDPRQVTEAQMESWAKGFDSWDVTDQVCTILFDASSHGWKKAREWAGREPQFVKRAGFSLMAGLAVHDKAAPDSAFAGLFQAIVDGAGDERAFVKKAVSWALRNIGKRNARLNRGALETARKISRLGTRSADWVARDVIKELESDAVKARLQKKARP